MRRRHQALLAIGLLAVVGALAVGWRGRVAAPAAPGAPSSLPPSGPPSRAQWTFRPAADLPPPVTGGAGAPSAGLPDALPPVVLGESPIRQDLPLCGRRESVAFRAAPGGDRLEESLSSCDALAEIAPHLERIEIRDRQGDWLGTVKGWVSIREVRTAEYLVVDGREYWHDLFESELDSFDGRFVYLRGALDPCDGAVCGEGDSGKSEKREYRTIELVPPPTKGKAGVKVHFGAYLCCT